MVITKAEKAKKTTLTSLNARFVIFDPNGEYANSFDDLGIPVKRFKVEIPAAETKAFQQLRIPAWFWNSYEWNSFTLATGRTQRPILRRALRELKGGVTIDPSDCSPTVRSYFSSCAVSLRSDINIGVAAFKEKPGKNEFGKKLSYANEASFFVTKTSGPLQKNLQSLTDTLQAIASKRYKTFVNEEGQTIPYYDGFEISEASAALEAVKSLVDSLGGSYLNLGPNEDMPVEFHIDLLPDHLEVIAEEQGVWIPRLFDYEDKNSFSRFQNEKCHW